MKLNGNVTKGTKSIYNNTIENLYTSATYNSNIYGINNTFGTSVNIYKNKILYKNDIKIKEKLAVRKSLTQFKEKVLILKFRALRFLWKEDLRLLSLRKQHHQKPRRRMH